MRDSALLKEHRKSIAAELRAEMARQSKTQYDLAEALGIAQASVSYKMRAHGSFDAEELALVAHWLSVPVAQFYVLTPASATTA